MRVTNCTTGTTNDILERISSSLSYSTGGHWRRYSLAPIFTRFCAFATRYIVAALASVIWSPTHCPASRIPGIGDFQQIAKSDCERKSISCNEGIIRCEPKIYLWQTSASQKNFSSFIFSKITVKIIKKKKNQFFVIIEKNLAGTLT